MAILSTVKPPPTTLSKKRRAYTIHDANNRMFSVQLPSRKDPTSSFFPPSTSKPEDLNITKTTILSFVQEHDALHMSHMLESHKAVNKEWPNTVFDEDFKLHFMLWNNSQIFTSELYILEWKIEDLQTYCIENIVDIILVKAMDVDDNNPSKMSIKSDLIRFDMRPEYYVKKFTTMMEK
jgi:hypothetical protein